MFEQVKTIIENDYNFEIQKFNGLKEKIKNIEEQIENDDSEKEYQNKLVELKKKYGVFKRGKKSDYQKELDIIQLEYGKKLKEFETLYEEYTNLKREAMQINIYGINQKLERLQKATSLEDLKMSEEEAQKIIDEYSNNVNQVGII